MVEAIDGACAAEPRRSARGVWNRIAGRVNTALGNRCCRVDCEGVRPPLEGTPAMAAVLAF